MKSKNGAMLDLEQFLKDTGAPEEMVTDSTREEKSQKVKQFINNFGIILRALEERTLRDSREELNWNPQGGS